MTNGDDYYQRQKRRLDRAIAMADGYLLAVGFAIGVPIGWALMHLAGLL